MGKLGRGEHHSQVSIFTMPSRSFIWFRLCCSGVLRRDSNSADVLTVRGLPLVPMAKSPSALKHAMSALRLDPESARAKHLRIRVKDVGRQREEGNALFKHNRRRDAIEKYGEAMEVRCRIPHG